ncbi:MAG: hypothetical protein RMI94_07010 [Bryobacterales bacterium]|nr:hypothetical protein [Bryobacteraceae bacterium]MDW8130282.1 hypothetical protein [Bryobacterales bacterium]
MKLGAEPRKVAILAVLLVVLAYVTYTNFSQPRTVPPVFRTEARATPTAPAARNPAAKATPPASSPALREFRPSLRPERRAALPDPATIDPTLRLDLLARLQSVTLTGGARNLFQFGPAPAPPQPEPKVVPKIEPRPAEEAKPADPPKPLPPPIPLKFYGYASPPRAGQRRAFFLNGDDIIVASEGEIIQKRYKVVRIGVNSAVVEDIEHKHQQTLTLEEPS